MGKAIVSTDCDAGPREILAPITPCGKKPIASNWENSVF